MNKIILSTHLVLSKWGHWGHSMNLGLPSYSPMFKERALKTPLYSATDPDPEMALVDHVVCKIESDHRALIIRKYCWRWPTRQFMSHYRWTFNRYGLQLEQSLWAVHTELEATELGDNPLICYKTHAMKHQNSELSINEGHQKGESLVKR